MMSVQPSVHFRKRFDFLASASFQFSFGDPPHTHLSSHTIYTHSHAHTSAICFLHIALRGCTTTIFSRYAPFVSLPSLPPVGQANPMPATRLRQLRPAFGPPAPSNRCVFLDPLGFPDYGYSFFSCCYCVAAHFCNMYGGMIPVLAGSVYPMLA